MFACIHIHPLTSTHPTHSVPRPYLTGLLGNGKTQSNQKHAFLAMEFMHPVPFGASIKVRVCVCLECWCVLVCHAPCLFCFWSEHQGALTYVWLCVVVVVVVVVCVLTGLCWAGPYYPAMHTHREHQT